MTKEQRKSKEAKLELDVSGVTENHIEQLSELLKQIKSANLNYDMQVGGYRLYVHSRVREGVITELEIKYGKFKTKTK